MTRTRATIVALLCSAAASVCHAKETGRSPDVRAAETLTKMTLEERLSLLRGLSFLTSRSSLPQGVPLSAGYVPGVARLGVPSLTETDASLGVANMMGILRRGDVATALPSGAALASSWDPVLVERASAMIGSEARAKGFNVLLAGGVNLVREPRNGRNFEYLGEDPLLAGVLAGHAIRGVQSNRIISTIKHYALNAQETGRSTLSANMEEAALRESDLLAFQIGIEIGQPGSVMCGYNQVNGVYACENSFLLNDVLRRDWGYKGFVMSDWGSVHSASIRQGLDQESGTSPKDDGYFGAKLKLALSSGAVSPAHIDRSALRILRTMYATGVIDQPVTPGGSIDYVANGRVAQEAAEKGMVLLKNDGGLLPIAATAKRILVVGGHADVGVLSGGGGSSQVNPVGGPALTITASNGRRFYVPSSPMLELKARLPGATITYDDGADVGRVQAAARQADLVLVFAEQFVTEAFDLGTIALPDKQDELIAALASANTKTVVVLINGGPILMPWLGKVGAVLEAWYPGQKGGHAIARVLTGEVNPSGRLPITFPATIDQTPNPKLPGSDIIKVGTGKSLYDIPKDQKHFPVAYPEGANVGYRWYDQTKARPLFAFGHGLSYTRFDYGDLKVSGGSDLKVTFKITNSGSRPGAEVAQVYAKVKGVRRLVGWSRVDLKPGESREVTVTSEPRVLASYDVRARNWRVAAGDYQVEVSKASDEPILSGTARLKSRRIRP